MAADLDEIDVVCPEMKNLTEVETNLTCPHEGCTKILPNTSALRMHLVKRHKTATSTKEFDVYERNNASGHNKVKKKTVYCCPVEFCVRGKDTGRYFHRLAHVKQHYMNVHGEKKFSCKKCEKKFGRNDVCLRHEKTCGMAFPCSCGVEFNSRTSMLTHAKRNNHTVPNTRKEKHEVERRESDTVAKPAGPVCISFVPVLGQRVLTAVRPIKPKKVFSDAGTQTEQPCCSNKQGLSLMKDNETMVQSEKGVLVNMQSARPDTDVLCKCTQTIDALPQGFMTDENFDVDFTIDNEEFKELAHSQTQTNWDLAFENFPLFEDNETQTLESYLEELDPANITIDCATQTKNILDAILSVDTETQTLLQAINFEEEFGNISCGTSMDGQTQTLPWKNFAGTETPLDILPSSTSNVETQTAQSLYFSQLENVTKD